MVIRMTEIVLASNNKKKIAELQVILGEALGDKVKVLSLSDIGFTGEIDEYGDTFEQNSLIKASCPAKLGYIGIADDSGLCVDTLKGAPGVYSARYSPEGTDAANRQKLLSELDGTVERDRKAAFVCAVSIVLPENCELAIPEKYQAEAHDAQVAGVYGNRAAVVRGECRGVILDRERGEAGFGYDSLFFSDDLKQTFAEASESEKNRVSHRGRAVRGMAAVIAEIMKGNNLC